MCDSCEEGDYYAEGYSVGEEVEGGVGWFGLRERREGVLSYWEIETRHVHEGMRLTLVLAAFDGEGTYSGRCGVKPGTGWVRECSRGSMAVGLDQNAEP